MKFSTLFIVAILFVVVGCNSEDKKKVRTNNISHVAKALHAVNQGNKTLAVEFLAKTGIGAEFYEKIKNVKLNRVTDESSLDLSCENWDDPVGNSCEFCANEDVTLGYNKCELASEVSHSCDGISYEFRGGTIREDFIVNADESSDWKVNANFEFKGAVIANYVRLECEIEFSFAPGQEEVLLEGCEDIVCRVDGELLSCDDLMTAFGDTSNSCSN